MNIQPSAAIRQNYNAVARYCKTTGEPVYLTKNGEGDLVVMDIESFERRAKMLELREKLLDIRLERLAGALYSTLDELDAGLEEAIAAAGDEHAAV